VEETPGIKTAEKSAIRSLPSLTEEIMTAKAVLVTQEQSFECMDIRYNEIAPNLFLGNYEGFVECYQKPAEAKFSTIITVNPLMDFEFLEHIQPPLKGVDDNTINREFSNNGVTWCNVGGLVIDQPEGWDALVHRCSCLQDKERVRYKRSGEKVPANYDQLVQEEMVAKLPHCRLTNGLNPSLKRWTMHCAMTKKCLFTANRESPEAQV
jgi:hypothetical protein